MKKIPMLNLMLEYEYMKEDIDSAVKACLDHQKWILGPEVKELEDRIAKYLGVKHSIGVSSGTDALVLSLRALAIKSKQKEYWDREDLIITTPFTFTATGDAILRAGATPVFVDIDPDTYNIDTKKLRFVLSSVSSANRVVGILPVHLYGQACDMDEIMKIAEEYGLFTLEDTAQAFGGNWKDKKLGSIGTAGAFSFFPSKNLGCFGDGGMIATNDDEVAECVQMLRKHGGKDKYNVEHLGYNARLDTIQAAVILAKLKYIDEFNERRRKTAEQYNNGLKDLSKPPLKLHHIYHQYTVCTSRRDKLQMFLKEKGISTMVYYPVPLNNMKVFAGRTKANGQLRNAELASKEVLSLPIGPLQTAEDTSYVIESITDFYKNCAVRPSRKTEPAIPVNSR